MSAETLIKHALNQGGTPVVGVSLAKATDEVRPVGDGWGFVRRAMVRNDLRALSLELALRLEGVSLYR